MIKIEKKKTSLVMWIALGCMVATAIFLLILY